MIIGIPKEIKTHEYRVSVTPSGAGALTGDGHRVLVESGAGTGSGFNDDDYKTAGAFIKDRDDVFKESELIVKVKEPLSEEFALFKEGKTLFTYLHLAPNEKLIGALLDKKISGFAYETLQSNGDLPLLKPMSEIAGRIAAIVGAFYLQRPLGGTGVLPPGATGVAPARALVLGAGTVGYNAAQIAHSLGMDVTVINRGVNKLSEIDKAFKGSVHTLPSTPEHIASLIKDVDLAIGAVLVKGARAPVLVSEALVKTMKKGAVIVDVAIDQGGCFETSRATTHDDPVYSLHGVTHYAVTNMPGSYPRTSTLALTNATIPYIRELARLGAARAIKENQQLKTALNTYKGNIAHKGLAESTGRPYIAP